MTSIVNYCCKNIQSNLQFQKHVFFNQKLAEEDLREPFSVKLKLIEKPTATSVTEITTQTDLM